MIKMNYDNSYPIVTALKDIKINKKQERKTFIRSEAVTMSKMIICN